MSTTETTIDTSALPDYAPIPRAALGPAGSNTLGLSEMRIANVMPYFFDETALRSAVQRLDALASPPPRDDSRSEVVG